VGDVDGAGDAVLDVSVEAATEVVAARFAVLLPPQPYTRIAITVSGSSARVRFA
jgi:hypothetical protein